MSSTFFLLWKKENASSPGPKIPRTKIYSGFSSLLILYLLCKTLYVIFSIRQFKTIVCLLIRYPCFILNLLQVNHCQKLLFLHQLTHNMTTDWPLNYEFSTWKLQAQNMGRTCCVHKLFFCFCFGIQNNLCTQHVLTMFSPMFWACNFHVVLHL